MRLMIVDDDEDMRDVLYAVLEHGGYSDVTTASSGAKALDVLGVGQADAPRAFRPDTILLDITMPEMDGIELCARIRQDARYQDTPIIMVTAMHDMGSLSQAFLAGANDYVRKPFDHVELLARVRNALKLKAELDRRQKREEALAALIEKNRESAGASLLDAETGLPSRVALEAMLRDRAARSGWVGVIQIDAWSAYREQYGSDAARALNLRIAETLGQIPAPLASGLVVLEPGLFALIAPDIGDREVERLLQRVREAVLKLRERHRDSPASAFVTISGGYAQHTAAQPGRALSLAMAAAATASQGGGDQILRATDDSTS